MTAGSAHVARTGYMFARGRRRTDSLAELARMAGSELAAYDHHPQAGDAVLFQPARVLHTLEDTPFYVRSVLESGLFGQRVTSVHETLNVPRLVSAPVRWMLPWRMPRFG